MGIIREYEKIYALLGRHLIQSRNFEWGGVLSEPVSLEYKAINRHPFINFECKEDDKYSFRIHEIEMGVDESIFWFMSIFQKSDKAKLTGFANRFYPKRGHLRGYLENEGSYHQLGLWIRPDRTGDIGRVTKLVTHEELHPKEDIELLSKITTAHMKMFKAEKSIENLRPRLPIQ